METKMKRNLTCSLVLCAFACHLVGCSEGDMLFDEDTDTGDILAPSKTDTAVPRDASYLATVLNFEFDGELVTNYTYNPRQTIQDQLLYSIGHLNGDKAVGRLDRLDLTNILSSKEGTLTRYTYHAKMPVAWGSKTNLPQSYTFTLPLNVSYEGTQAFTEKYKASCIEAGAHDVDSGSMWYYYRPKASGCTLADGDVFKTTASIVVSPTNTTGRFPEYHRVWEDNALKVVAVFGKYEDGATEASDAGISAYNEFVGAIHARLKTYPMTTIPMDTIPTAPGVEMPDIELNATLPDGRTVQVNALLVDNIAAATTAFYARYNRLSSRADVIAYNGHAGLGQNVRAIAKKGSWVAEQYLIMFMNGCDTYAYVDGYMASARARINPSDPTGTKYMDIITNAMPAFFASDSEASMAIISGLLDYAAPKTYEQIFKSIDSHQIVLVTGEEDNVYLPGYELASAKENQEVLFEKPVIAGSYTITTRSPVGNIDLYVRVGSQPTTTEFDCKSDNADSNEECEVTVTEDSTIFIKVIGRTPGESAFAIATKPKILSLLSDSGMLAKNEERRYQTGELAVGTYIFKMTGTGDADLYVRKGAAPMTTTYDCRPYKSGSVEECTVALTTPTTIHVMVRGYKDFSTFELVGNIK